MSYLGLLRSAGRGGLRRRVAGWRLAAVVLVSAVLVSAGSPAFAIPTDPENPNLPPCLANTTGWLTVSSATVHLGNSVTLKWKVTGCSGLTYRLENRPAGKVINEVTAVGESGSMVVWPSGYTRWTLIATWSPGVTKTVGNTSVAVVLPVVNGRTTVTVTADNQLALFLQAIGVPNAVIHIQNHVNLNLSYLGGLQIAPGVHILGGRTSKAPGPRLFTTSFPARLFEIGIDLDGDNVRISGIRLQGAEMGVADGDAYGTIAIAIYSSVNVQIDNNEIFGWRGVGISVRDPWQRISLRNNAAAVRIQNNYIHHNRHYGREGYGVAVYDGTYALIEKNVFDYNRHAIAAQGSPGNGYLAYRNLILEHGGENSGFPFYANTHMLDMHGTANCNGFHLYCGPAGEYMDIRYNTVLYTAGAGFKLRGTPAIGADVAYNVFAHSEVWGGYVDDAALVQIEGHNLTQWGNQFGLNTLNETGWCDFNADGIADRFLATGATWWYSSSGTGHWVYLNTSTKRRADVTLADVNSDGRCDVTANGHVSFGGTTSPQPLLTASHLLWQGPGGQLRVSHISNGVFSHESYPGVVDGSRQILGTGDFDGDGDGDVLLRNVNTGSIIMLALHDGVPAGESQLGVQPDASVAGIGDFDGNGISDVLWGHSDGRVTLWPNGSGLKAMQPPGLSINAPVTANPALRVKGVGDFDGDGRADILWRHTTTGQVTIWYMAGGVRIGEGYPGGADPSELWRIQGVGDFDGDGRADILWRNNTGQLSIWFKGSNAGAAYPSQGNTPGGPVEPNWSTQEMVSGVDTGGVSTIMLSLPIDPGDSGEPSEPKWKVEGVADLDADGKADILWRMPDGQLTVWMMNGGLVVKEAIPGAVDTTWHLNGIVRDMR